MFAILPTEGYPKEEVVWYADFEKAYDAALGWSVDLHGSRVNVYEHYAGKMNKIAEVFA